MLNIIGGGMISSLKAHDWVGKGTWFEQRCKYCFCFGFTNCQSPLVQIIQSIRNPMALSKQRFCMFIRNFSRCKLVKILSQNTRK